jgi:hypothetical protein
VRVASGPFVVVRAVGAGLWSGAAAPIRNQEVLLMLCSYYRAGHWHWLAGHEYGDGEVVLLERRGACPGDPGGEPIAVAGRVASDEVRDRAAEWLTRGWAVSTADRVAPRVAALVPASAPVAPDRGDRTLAPVDARAVIEAAVDAQDGPFCLFPNPAAQRA